MIGLQTPLSLKSAFTFPLQNPQAKKEIIIGGLLLLIPVIGWLLNMGHRIMIVHKMQHGQDPWPSWENWGILFKHGVITWMGMIYYYIPALTFVILAHLLDTFWPNLIAVILFSLATIAIPGYMSHYCLQFDCSEIFNPFKALRRSFEGGSNYWLAWRIAITALLLSFLGLIVFGFGFLITSVWFWQVAGYSFANTFTNAYQLKSNEIE